MGLFGTQKRRPRSKGKGSPLTNKASHLSQRINKLEQFIEDAPDRIRREMEEERTSMPAPDDLADRQREKVFYTNLSRGQVRNERRHQTQSAFLFILMATAIASLSSWIYTFLQGV